MIPEDRPFQDDMIERVRANFRECDSVLSQMPTGAGKTCLAAKGAGLAALRGKSIFFLCHRDYLIHQTSKTFEAFKIPHGFIAAGMPYNPWNKVHICSVQTLARRLDKLLPPDLLIWDEAHHLSASTWAKIFQWAQGKKHWGLTATPGRTDGRGLDKFFQALVCGPSVSWLIEHGYLSRYRAYAPATVDVSGIHVRGGDYAVDELEQRLDDGQIIGDLVRHYRALASGKRAVFYGVSVRHSQHIAATFNQSGIPAIHLDGTTPTSERTSAAEAIAYGRVKIITCADLISEGFDLGAAAGIPVTIDCVGMARPSQSMILVLQQMGRCLRPMPGKDHAVILDFAGNLARFGLPDDEREWSLAGVERRKKPSDSLAVMQCGHCFGVYRSTLTVCPYCGTVRVVQGGREVEEVAGELAEVVARPRVVDLDRAKAKGYDALVALAQRRGYRNPARWAMYVHEAREKKARDRQMELMR